MQAQIALPLTRVVAVDTLVRFQFGFRSQMVPQPQPVGETFAAVVATEFLVPMPLLVATKLSRVVKSCAANVAKVSCLFQVDFINVPF